MTWRPRSLGVLLLLYAAALGYALVFWAPELFDRYERLAEDHPRAAQTYLIAVVIGGVLLAAASIVIFVRLWRNTARKTRRDERRKANPGELSAKEQQAEFADNLASSRELSEEDHASPELQAALKVQLHNLEEKQAQQQLEIVAFGTISSGKSTLLNALAGRDVFAANVVGGTTTARCEIPWPGNDSVVLVDTPGLAEVHGEGRAAASALAAQNADLVLLVVDGPLKAYEVELADQLLTMEKRLLLCLNKEDWYDQRQQDELVAQIAQQLPRIEPADVIALRAAPSTRPQVRVLPDGTEERDLVATPPDVQPLARRMLEVIRRDGRDLLLANLLLQSRGLVDEAKQQVRSHLDQRADQLITKYMWAAGGAAAVNPLPLLDLAGSSAITLKMVLDLARVYRQPLDAEMAVKMLAQLSKNLLAMIGTTAAAPVAGSLLGSMLKTVPGVGTLAGGLVQGVSQALITRWVGNVFVRYLQNEMKTPPGGIVELARGEWQKLTKPESLRRLISAGRAELQSTPRAAVVSDEMNKPLPRISAVTPAGRSQEVDADFLAAMASIEAAILQFKGCNPDELRELTGDLEQLGLMAEKLRAGRVDVVVFGEISTGKSALINALCGEQLAEVNVRGGWTKDVWNVPWALAGYCVPGFMDSQLVLVDTPGLNEVDGASRAEMAHAAAARADLVIFVTDSDLNDAEYRALLELASSNKPLILVLNKADLYRPDQLQDLLGVFRGPRVAGFIRPENIVTAQADPRDVEYVIESPAGRTRSEWRKPLPQIDEVRARVIELLATEGKALLALNAAIFAADKSDRMNALRVRYREEQAASAIWSFAATKALAVAYNPIAVADVLGGIAVDAAMVVTLGRIYGISISMKNARSLASSIAKSAGLVTVFEAAVSWASSAFKALTGGLGSVLTHVPQGAAAGYGSYIVGQAARYYFQHGANWGDQSPKQVVSQILKNTDKQSVLDHLKAEILKKLSVNRHANAEKKPEKRR